MKCVRLTGMPCFFFFFLVIFWNWSPYKNKIKSVWFRCFILGNVECILSSHHQGLSAADLCDSSTAPLGWPFTLSLTQTDPALFPPQTRSWPLLPFSVVQQPIQRPRQELNSVLSSPQPHHLIGPQVWTSPILVISPLCCYYPGSSTTIFCLANPNSLLLAGHPFPILPPLNPLLPSVISITVKCISTYAVNVSVASHCS